MEIKRGAGTLFEPAVYWHSHYHAAVYYGYPSSLQGSFLNHCHVFTKAFLQFSLLLTVMTFTFLVAFCGRRLEHNHSIVSTAGKVADTLASSFRKSQFQVIDTKHVHLLISSAGCGKSGAFKHSMWISKEFPLCMHVLLNWGGFRSMHN